MFQNKLVSLLLDNIATFWLLLPAYSYPSFVCLPTMSSASNFYIYIFQFCFEFSQGQMCDHKIDG